MSDKRKHHTPEEKVAILRPTNRLRVLRVTWPTSLSAAWKSGSYSIRRQFVVPGLGLGRGALQLDSRRFQSVQSV